jgi:hypothetical protein
LKEIVTSLETINFRHFSKNITFVDTSSRSYGEAILSLESNSNELLQKSDTLSIEGWIIPPIRERALTMLYFSYDDRRTFFASLPVYRDLANQIARWKITLPEQTLPVGERTIQAWVHDRKSQQFIKLKGDIQISVGGNQHRDR